MKKADVFFIAAIAIPSILSLGPPNTLYWIPLYLFSGVAFWDLCIKKQYRKARPLLFATMVLVSLNLIINLGLSRYFFPEELVKLVLAVPIALFFIFNTVSKRVQRGLLVLIVFTQTFLVFSGLEYRAHWAPWLYLSHLLFYLCSHGTSSSNRRGLIILVFGGLYLALISDSRSSLLIFSLLSLTAILPRARLGGITQRRLRFIPLVFLSGLLFTIINIEGVVSFMATLSLLEATSLADRGLKLGPREVIYSCYLSNFELSWLFIGVSIPDLWQACGLSFPNIAFGMSESSLMNILSLMGVVGVCSLFLSLFWSSLLFIKDIMLACVLLSFFARALTGDFIGGSVHDWLYFYIFFVLMGVRDVFESFRGTQQFK